MNRKIANRLTAATIVVAAMSITGAATAANLEVDFDGAVFTNPTFISNVYWPLTSGVSHVYFAETEDGCEVNMVTGSDTRNGFGEPYDEISARAVEDLEWFSEDCDGDYILMEKTTDWYAQDDDDNIWYMGEETVAYDDEGKCLTDEGAWEAGEDDAEAGIVILGTPIKGLAYQQEYLEDEAEDMGKVLNLNVTVELESFGPFTDCLKTKEWTPLERGHVEHKFYCPVGGGLMLINELHGKTVRVEYIGDSLPEGDFPEELPEVDSCPEE
jgi:hypothetical protein